MTATGPKTVADRAETRAPRGGGRGVRDGARSVWRRIDRADAAQPSSRGCARP